MCRNPFVRQVNYFRASSLCNSLMLSGRNPFVRQVNYFTQANQRLLMVLMVYVVIPS